MNRILPFYSALVSIPILIATPVFAAVFERDWQTPGDGLLTYDDVNKREWLDLTETQLFKYPGADLEEQYQAVLAEVSPGGEFAEFTPATQDDVIALAHSSGIDTSTDEFPTNGPPVSNFIYSLGATLALNGNEWSYGFLSEIENNQRRSGGAGYVPGGRDSTLAGFGIGFSAREDHGVWLYRRIPEPSTAVLFAVSFMLARVARTVGRM